MSRQINVTKDRAFCQLFSWLRSVGIPAEPTSDTDIPCMILSSKDGQTLKVYFNENKESSSFHLDHVEIAPSTFSSLSDIHKVFYGITELLGYGRPEITLRGEAPSRSIRSNTDDFDLVIMRHCEFRRVPNPPQEVMDFYRNTQNIAVRNFYSGNQAFCKTIGLEVEDLMTYAQVWTCNFHGLFAIRESKADDNKRLLHNYIKQRFNELRAGWFKRLKNTNHDAESMDLFYTDIESSNQSSPAELLTEKLNELPHEELVRVLAFASTNRSLGRETRAEAKARLHRHKKSCKYC